MNDDFLDDISIASPCSANWNQMTGDDRRRFCSSCRLDVHNISGMTGDEAKALLRQAAGDRVCVRFFRRTDGTVLTRDCPVGWRQQLRRAAGRAATRAAALWLALWTSACGRNADDIESPPTGPSSQSTTTNPVQTDPVHLMGEVEMGAVAPPPPKGQEPEEQKPGAQKPDEQKPAQKKPVETMGRVSVPTQQRKD